MPNTINSQYMSLPVPVPTKDPGAQYAFDLNTCLTLIDQHDHSTGKGAPITPGSINITSDLNFNSNNAINLRSARFTAQSGPIAGVLDLGCIYVSGVDLFYNDENGNQIRLTQSGTIAAPPGSIAGLVSPANVTYVSGTQTFVFQSTTATAANIDVQSVTLRASTANSPGITISANSSLPGNYTMTLPSQLPASSSYLSISAAGNIGYATPTINISNWQIYPLTISAVTTNPTTGTIVTNKAQWRRIGDSMQIRFDYYQNGGGGSAGSGIYLFNIPAGFTIDSSKIDIGNANGLTGNCGSANVQTGNNSGSGFVVARSSTALSILFYNSALVAAGTIFADNGNTPLTATSAAFSFLATVPITGWSI